MTSPEAQVVLASASPRRRQILAALGIPFESIDVNVDERPRPGEPSEQLARRLATAKAQVAAHLYPGRITIGADTVVALDDEPLGKPRTADEALQMLRRLRGREHRVITAVAATRREPGPAANPVTWIEDSTTRVWMRAYTDQEIHSYIASGDPFDKAGSYAIQHETFRPVERIEGCFLTVVGLPLPEVCAVLARAGGPSARLSAVALDAVCPRCADRDRLLR